MAPQPVTVLEAEMRRRNWSREDLRDDLLRTARDIGERRFTVSLRQLDRWLSGEGGVPRPAARRVLERLFDRPVAVLLGPLTPPVAAPVAGGTAEDPPAHVDRLTVRAAAVAREHSRTQASAAVDPVSIEALHLEVRRLARGYAYTPPLLLLGELVGARDRAYQLLERTRRPGDLADLYLIAGQLCGLAATTSWDLGDPDAADDLANAAWTYGQMCGHDTLRAWIRSVQATVAFWSGRPGEGLRYVADGLLYAHGSAAARLHAIGARAWSMNGAVDQAVAALRRAYDARDGGHEYDEMTDGIGGEFSFPPVRLALCSGAVYVGLGDGPAAARGAVETLQLYERTPSDQRRWAVRHAALIDLATARAQQSDPDGAAEAIGPALELDPARRTARLARRLHTLRQVVARSPFRAVPAARTLTEAVDDWVTVALPAAGQPLALPSGR